MLQGLHLLSDARKGKSLQSLSAFLQVMANAGVSTWSNRFESCLVQKHVGEEPRQRGLKNSHRSLVAILLRRSAVDAEANAEGVR